MKRQTKSVEYISVGEAAELIGVNKETLRRWDRKGILKPELRIGARGDRRYKVEIVKSFVTQ